MSDLKRAKDYLKEDGIHLSSFTLKAEQGTYSARTDTNGNLGSKWELRAITPLEAVTEDDISTEEYLPLCYNQSTLNVIGKFCDFKWNESKYN